MKQGSETKTSLPNKTCKLHLWIVSSSFSLFIPFEFLLLHIIVLLFFKTCNDLGFSLDYKHQSQAESSPVLVPTPSVFDFHQMDVLLFASDYDLDSAIENHSQNFYFSKTQAAQHYNLRSSKFSGAPFSLPTRF